MTDIDISDYQRIMKRAHKVDDCLIVPSESPNGDITIRTKDGTVKRAHIIVWEVAHNNGNPAPYLKFVVRSCGTPGCVAPAHLELIDGAERERRRKAKAAAMTQAEKEAREAARELTRSRGLSATEVRAIYDDPRSQRQIALDFGCSPATVHKIKAGKIRAGTTGHIAPGEDEPKRDKRIKVTDEDVIKIRDDGRPYRQIAKDYGISHVMVFRIKNLINRANAKIGN